MKREELQIGKRVRATFDEFSMKGTIIYVDWPTLYQHHLLPIQILLDEPPTKNSFSRTLRFSIKELKPVKKGRRRK